MELDNLHATAPLLLSEYKRQLTVKDKVVSRHTINSTYTLALSDGISLNGDTTNRYILNGRRAGAKMPPETEQFRQWLMFRNIPLAASFVIRRSIGRNGIRPTDLLTPTIAAIQPLISRAIFLDTVVHYRAVATTIINSRQ